MRFSDNGYYIEKYVKCATCGMLVYGPGIAGSRHGEACVYCSDWCVEWARRRDAGLVEPRLPIVQPAMPIEKQHRPLGPRKVLKQARAPRRRRARHCSRAAVAAPSSSSACWKATRQG